MRLLKGHPDQTDTDSVSGKATSARRWARRPGEEPTPHVGETPTVRRWGRRTVTVPMTVPERSVRRTVTLPSRSRERASARPRLSLGPLVAVAVGAALAVVGAVAVLRAGLDATWHRPRVEVLDADHTALLGGVEIGAGLLLLLAGLAGSRVMAALLGLAMALGAMALVIEPDELQRELAVETWWASALAAAGVVVTIAALQAPRRRRETVVEVA